MSIAAIVAALVVIAVIVLLVSRGRSGSAGLLPPGSTPPAASPRVEGPAATRAASTRPGAAAAKAPSEAPKAAPATAGGSAGPESLPPSAVVSARDSARVPPTPAPEPKDVATLRKGLGPTRGGLIAKLAALFQQKTELDGDTLARVEEILLAGDVGPKTTKELLARLSASLEGKQRAEPDAIWSALRAEATRILSLGGGGIRTAGKPTVVLMVGVNGVGKTTTIGKLATRFTGESKKVVLAAGDTFRAAATQQLEVWGKRVGAEVVRGKEGADPGAVAFDATTRAKEGGADLLFVDTAGRLHTKAPLMDEIKKVRKTIGKALDGAPHETLLVLDATTGQNGLQQAAIFREALDLTGVVLTKLDGTAKGGVVLSICDELKIPVRYVGLGERAEDLREFRADEFVEALFGKPDMSVQAT